MIEAPAASHVEPKLMLFYTCHLLGTFTGIQSISEPVGRLYKLRNMKSSPKAEEVFLSRVPCQSCKRFQELFKDLTGIKFIIKDGFNVLRGCSLV